MDRSNKGIAGVLLILSTGLYGVALGSFSADGDKVSSDFDLHVLRGKFKQSRAQALTRDGLPSGAVGSTILTRLPDRDLDQAANPVGNIALVSEMVSVSAINSRSLKEESCDEGYTSISVTSTVFPDMEGCFSLIQDGAQPFYGNSNSFSLISWSQHENQAAGDDLELVLNTCPGDGSFAITSNANPELDGCFGVSATGMGSLVYTASRTTTLSEITIFPLEAATGDFDWVIGFLTVTEDSDPSLIYCFSAESARDVNPGKASWICDFSGESTNVLPATEEDISIVCGSCITAVPTSAPAISPTPAPSQITQTPGSSQAPIGGFPSLFDSCGGDGSFAITSNSTPTIDGCFKDTFVSTEEQSVMYTVSGTENGTGLVVSSLDRGNRDFKWIVTDVSLTEDGSRKSLLYCLSVETASDVNPGNATWLCDLSGQVMSFLPASDRNISIACGPCTTAAVPVTDTPDASPSSTLSVGVATVFVAGLAVVASTLAGRR